jgi:hypothetical protein
MHRSQVIGVLMTLVGVALLILLAGFVVSVIVTLLELLAVIVGVILILGGIAMLIFGRRIWRRGPWGWGGPPAST